jgi:hypothetical protein
MENDNCLAGAPFKVGAPIDIPESVGSACIVANPEVMTISEWRVLKRNKALPAGRALLLRQNPQSLRDHFNPHRPRRALDALDRRLH